MPTLEEVQEELVTLRTAHNEVLTKSRDRKAKVSELEGKLATAEASLREYEIVKPLHQLAEEASIMPDLFIMMFEKHYNLERRNGVLTVLDANGKPILVDGKPLPFTPKAVGDYVSSGDSATAKQFARLTIATRASDSGTTGGKQGTDPMSGVTNTGKPKEEAAVPLQQFGLR